MRRPRVTNPARPADQYAGPGERIIEFYDDKAEAGGLISLRRIDGNDGRATLHVSVYRVDDDVEVSTRGIATSFPEVDALRTRIAELETELSLLRACSAYSCCCIQGASCDCFTKRDPDWRAIPGNYPCRKCCNDDCIGITECPAECVCDEGENCAAFVAARKAAEVRNAK